MSSVAHGIDPHCGKTARIEPRDERNGRGKIILFPLRDRRNAQDAELFIQGTEGIDRVGGNAEVRERFVEAARIRVVMAQAFPGEVIVFKQIL